MVAVSGKSYAPRAVGLLAIATLLFLTSASSAFGAASYVFEPTLSLTGDCTTSPLDEVPDPGVCPGSLGKDHPSTPIENPTVATDAYGDIYVINGSEDARSIDVFCSDGTFITELKDALRPQSLAVDSKGNLYLFESPTSEVPRMVERFSPTVYEPGECKIKYEDPPVVVAKSPAINFGGGTTLAVDAGDLLYIDDGEAISIFKSAADGNELVAKAAIVLTRTQSISVDSVHEKIYLADKVPGSSVVRVFESTPPYAELPEDVIDGSTTPQGEFLTGEGAVKVAVDDPTGHVFVGDRAAAKVYEFEEDGTYLATIQRSFEGTKIAVDDGPFSPHSKPEGWLFVASGLPKPGHIYAFEPKEECEPKLESTSVGEVTETEATLHATINPCGLETTYRLEYVSQQQFEAEEGKSFENEKATVAGEGILAKSGEGIAVSAQATGLEPETQYRFRAFAENAKGKKEVEKIFKTFPPEEPPVVCENKGFRVGASALLPDCRAYELVTPPSTNGRAPSAGFGVYTFPTLRSAADGNLVSFLIEGGALPGAESAGSFNGDPYLAARGSEGWSSSNAGPSGKEAVGPAQHGISPDQAYSVWGGVGDPALHIRYPDGHSELVGRGSLGEDPRVEANLITENATHIVFSTEAGSAVKLEPNAAPAGTATVYDRSAEGPTRVVSLLPENKEQKAGENATYLGADEKGEGIAFEINGTIYLRLHDTETFKVAGPGTTFAGVADEGKRVFYLEGGNLFAYDAEEEKVIPFSSSGDITPVNVASGGTRVYFVSPTKLTSELNPNEEEAEVGQENLYLSEEGQISFVGILTERDVEGKEQNGGKVNGLGLWVKAIKEAAPALDPSRTTPAGTTLLFESRANLTGFESEGFAQVFRYDSAQNRLDCLSCSPTGTPPTSDASLQSVRGEQFLPEPGDRYLLIPNQSPDGKRAIFQTAEPLVIGDTDGLQDVYEWEEEGMGSCETEGGCVYLVSAGHSASPDYLYSMTPSGNDVFFRTADVLLPRDLESTLSIYDARVGGGFPEPLGKVPCRAVDTCHPASTPPPSQPPSTTSVVGPDGNAPPVGRKCPKGKRAVQRGGKTVCVKKHRKHRTGSGRKGGAK